MGFYVVVFLYLFLVNKLIPDDHDDDVNERLHKKFPDLEPNQDNKQG